MLYLHYFGTLNNSCRGSLYGCPYRIPHTRTYAKIDKFLVLGKSNSSGPKKWIARSEKNSLIAKKINEKFSAAKGDYISIIEGTYEIVIFTNQKHKKVIRKLVSGCKITSEADNLAYITVNWENNTKDIPGIYYRITRALALKNISIQSFHTVGAEMMIFFKEGVFQEASQTILHLLKNSSQM